MGCSDCTVSQCVGACTDRTCVGCSDDTCGGGVSACGGGGTCVDNTAGGTGEYVEMTRYRWDCPPVISGGGDFYQEQVGTEPVVDRYYALNDGIETHLTTLQLRSKLTEHEPIVEETDVRVELATRIRELLDRFDARAIAVDFVAGEDGDFYAVGVDPVPSFDGADMDRRVADSMASLTTIGA